MHSSFPALRIQFEAAKLLIRIWRPVLVYGVAAHVVVSLALSPFFLWMLAEVLSLVRSHVVLNYDVASLALSVEGMALGLLWANVASTLVVASLGGLAVLTSAAYAHRTVSVRMVARRVFGSLHRVPGVGCVKLSLLVVAAAPLAGAAATALTAVLLSPFGTEPEGYWMPNEVRELAWVVPAGLVLLCVANVLYARWSLSIHCMLLERVSLTAAARQSVAIVRGSLWLVLRTLGLYQVSVAVGLGVLGLMLGFLDRLALMFVWPEQGLLFPYFVAVLLVVNTVAIGLAAIFFAGYGMTVGTCLYVRLQKNPILVGAEGGPQALKRVAGRRRVWNYVVILLAVGLAALFTVPQVKRELEELDTAVAVTAHRGSSGEAPENTLAALKLAIDDGADFAEFDVQEAADGTVVVLHDESVKRVAGVDRSVWEMTLEQLQALDVGRWFDERFSGERIATLDEFLMEAKGRIRVNIEIKPHGRQRRLVRSVVDSIHRAQFGDACVITSTDYRTLRQVRKLDPALRIGVVVAAKVGRLHMLDVDFYSVQPNYATVAFIREAHRRQRDVHVWTVNDPAAIERFADRGVDNIITDYPRRVLSILDGRSEIDELVATVVRLFER